MASKPGGLAVRSLSLKQISKAELRFPRWRKQTYSCEFGAPRGCRSFCQQRSSSFRLNGYSVALTPVFVELLFDCVSDLALFLVIVEGFHNHLQSVKTLRVWQSPALRAPCRKRECAASPLFELIITININQKQQPLSVGFSVSLYSSTRPAFCCCLLLFKS